MTVTLLSVAWPHAGQKSLEVDLMTVRQPSQRCTTRCNDVMRLPPRDSSRSPICSATFCAYKHDNELRQRGAVSAV